jgi:hypothetical protein
MRIHLRSVAVLAVNLAASAVALIMSAVEKVGQAQDEAAPLMPDDLETGFTEAEYHEAICNAVELMADERREDVAESDFLLWMYEPCVAEVVYR